MIIGGTVVESFGITETVTATVIRGAPRVTLFDLLIIPAFLIGLYFFIRFVSRKRSTGWKREIQYS